MLERLFEKEKIIINSLHGHELTHLIQCALVKCKRAKIKKSVTNYFRLMLGLMKNAKRKGECGKSKNVE